VTDQSWRDWERRWEADPADQEALERTVAARMRAGLTVPGRMLDQRLYPARRFNTDLKLSVWVLLPGGQARQVGKTPSPTDLLLPKHRAWWLRARAITDPTLAPLVRLVRDDAVPGLSLDNAHLTPFSMDTLASLRHLTRLGLPHCHGLTSRSLRLLAPLRQLTYLDLSDCGISGGLEHLEGLPLRHLDLSGCQINEAAFDEIPRLRELSRVTLGRCQVTSRMVERLAELPELEALDLRICTFEQGALYELRGLAELRNLDLQHCTVNDQDLALLARVRGLSSLDLSWCKQLGPDGLTHLSALSDLRRLKLYSCEQLTNTSVKVLSKLKGLTRLDVSHTKLTKTRVAALVKALPECKVVATTEGAWR
jgi:Leucine-rich repeat (LRR) protein